MSLFDPPSPPDPYTGMVMGAQVAGAQNTLNTATGESNQRGSMVDQYNPYGSLTYSQTGTGPNGVPIYSANVNLTPEQQNLFNTLQSTKGSAAGGANALMAGANYGSTSPADAVGTMTSGITGDLMSKQMQYYQPFFTTARDQLDTRLRNQGIAPGNPAYDNAMRSLDTSQAMTVEQAAAQFQPQAFQEASNLYTLPASLGTSLATFGAPGSPTSQLVQNPSLNIQTPDLTGATATETAALNNQYNAQMQQYSNMMSGLFGIPSAILGGWAKGGGLGSLGSALGSLGGAAGGAGVGDALGSAGAFLL